MLQIWTLNVGHGDSLVLKYTGPKGPAFGVIDSNRASPNVDPPALDLLYKLGARELSFVIWTHPHADHFSGLSSILKAFTVRTFLSYPIGRDMKRLKAHGAMYLDAATKSTSITVKNQAHEFVTLIVIADKKCNEEGMEWLTLEGPTNRFRAHGFAEVKIEVMLPFKRVKGEYFNALDANRANIAESEPQNELCLALDVSYGDHRIALCADAPKRAWVAHRKELTKSNEILSFTAVKMPHHGSKLDCDDVVLDYLFPTACVPNTRSAVISAGGTKKHPAEAVLRSLRARDIKPYCTNLSHICGSKKIVELFTGAALSAEIAKQLRIAGANFKNGPSQQPCQGTVCLNVPTHGDITIDRQYQNGCWFRGDFDGILQAVPSATT